MVERRLGPRHGARKPLRAYRRYLTFVDIGLVFKCQAFRRNVYPRAVVLFQLLPRSAPRPVFSDGLRACDSRDMLDVGSQFLFYRPSKSRIECVYQYPSFGKSIERRLLILGTYEYQTILQNCFNSSPLSLRMRTTHWSPKSSKCGHLNLTPLFLIDRLCLLLPDLSYLVSSFGNRLSHI